MSAPVIKAAVMAAVGTIAALIIRRGSAEMSAVLSLAVCAAGMYIAAQLLLPIFEVLERARAMSGLNAAAVSPVVKCTGIALLTRITSDMCRDGGQAAMASSVEFVGAVGALYAALPLISTMMDMLEELM